jgi:hypothetical protein
MLQHLLGERRAIEIRQRQIDQSARPHTAGFDGRERFLRGRERIDSDPASAEGTDDVVAEQFFVLDQQYS